MSLYEKPDALALAAQYGDTLAAELWECAETCKRLLTTPRDITVTEWADANRHMHPGTTSAPGKWDTDKIPYQRDWMDSFTDPDVQVTVLMIASALGKTECTNNAIGYFVDHDPSQIMVLYPIKESAESWMKNKFMPMAMSTPCLGKLFPGGRGNDSRGQTIMHKMFPGGWLGGFSARTPTNLAQHNARVLWADEIDRFPDSAGKEGDPVTLFFNRAINFSNAVKILSSTPTIKGGSRIETWYDMSDKQQWFCSCVRCGQYQVMNWDQARPLGRNFEDTFYECAHCKGELSDSDRIRMIRGGESRATAEFNGVRGFHMEGICNLMPPSKGFKTRLHQMAVAAHEAKKQPLTHRVWLNTFRAQTWTEENDSADPEPLIARRENYTTMPKEVLMLTVGGDVQANRVELEIVGWGLGEESWGLDFQIFEGSPQSFGMWQKIREWLFKVRMHPEYGQMFPAAVAIDSGHCAKIVYQFCKQCRPRPVYPIKGSSVEGAPPAVLAKRSGVIMIGTDGVKELIYSRIKLAEAGPGFMHYPKDSKELGYDDEYFKQLTSERIETIWKNGRRKRKWICPDHRRNEALDIRVYATAAFLMLNPQLDKLALNLAKRRITKDGTAPSPAPAPKPLVRRHTSGGMGGWL